MAHTLSSSGYTVRTKRHMNIILDIDTKIINNNINKFLQNCKLFVFGYDVRNDLYYGKKNKNGALVFHFVLKIVCKGDKLTHIEINVLHDDKHYNSSLGFARRLIQFINEI